MENYSSIDGGTINGGGEPIYLPQQAKSRNYTRQYKRREENTRNCIKRKEEHLQC
jgi:hypothetical protein